jgi:hypothetical protein
MKKSIIAVVVVTLILFVWQTLSWMVFQLHNDVSKYTHHDKEIMSVVNTHITEDGAYMMPGYDPKKEYTNKERESMVKENVGKPYVILFYHKAFPGFAPSMMLTSVLFNMIAAILAVFLVTIAASAGTSFVTRFCVAMALPVFCIFQGPLLNWNWWQFPTHFIKGEIMDAVIGWGMASLFLARYVKTSVKA